MRTGASDGRDPSAQADIAFSQPRFQSPRRVPAGTATSPVSLVPRERGFNRGGRGRCASGSPTAQTRPRRRTSRFPGRAFDRRGGCLLGQRQAPSRSSLANGASTAGGAADAHRRLRRQGPVRAGGHRVFPAAISIATEGACWPVSLLPRERGFNRGGVANAHRDLRRQGPVRAGGHRVFPAAISIAGERDGLAHLSARHRHSLAETGLHLQDGGRCAPAPPTAGTRPRRRTSRFPSRDFNRRGGCRLPHILPHRPTPDATPSSATSTRTGPERAVRDGNSSASRAGAVTFAPLLDRYGKSSES
jgi:hypothetical protein